MIPINGVDEKTLREAAHGAEVTLHAWHGHKIVATISNLFIIRMADEHGEWQKVMGSHSLNNVVKYWNEHIARGA